ncbi:MAG: peptide-methionine (S)-S-oxide reductase MsrA [Armatimonadetes bacterium]|nr:peptide-methionine (S)-S-oxide reductase MsrA [Armatimonadota bacterium]
MQSVIVAGGCFWCIEPLFEELEGVSVAESAYVGGARKGVSYEEVCSGASGHAEALRVVFDPKKITAHDILTIFMTIHNPTTLNRQGGDSGTQYRSAIFFNNAEEKALGEKVIKEIGAAMIWDAPIVTTLEPVLNFTRAEEYHQDYYNKYDKASDEVKSKMNSGYCAVIISPKVAKFREQFKARLKK